MHASFCFKIFTLEVVLFNNLANLGFFETICVFPAKE